MAARGRSKGAESAQLIRDFAAQSQGARACELATAQGVTGPATPFVSVSKPPASVAQQSRELPVRVSWLR